MTAPWLDSADEVESAVTRRDSVEVELESTRTGSWRYGISHGD